MDKKNLPHPKKERGFFIRENMMRDWIEGRMDGMVEWWNVSQSSNLPIFQYTNQIYTLFIATNYIDKSILNIHDSQ